VKVSLDVNLRVETSQMDTQYLRRAMACADFLLGSAEDELVPLTGCPDADTAARKLVTQKRVVIARLGAKGATVYSSSGESHCDAFPVIVADTLGAGDCYTSGFLFALTHGYDLAFANVCGCAAGAMSLVKPGARNCPTRADLFAFLHGRGISIPASEF
jgi:2-dehydro-3-deoxygluconokinase